MTTNRTLIRTATRIFTGRNILTRSTRRVLSAGAVMLVLLVIGFFMLSGRSLPSLQSGAAPALPAPVATTTPELDPAPPAAPTTPEPAPPAAPISTDAGEALAQLEQLTIAEPYAKKDYVRDYFGQRWADVDRNGCDTRNDILARDLTDITFKPGTNDCVVLSGVLYDRYTEETVQFVRVSTGYQPAQADHVVSLFVGWFSGAEGWTPEKREQFANDPLNLQITTANQQKGEFTPSRWMPTSPTAACEFSARYVMVLDAYDLTITTTDAAALRSTLSSCSMPDGI